ncbi:cell division protein FtsA [Leadbetterella byssophila]|jgi:cell division protein FtsA|uniref:cell division protein FtsA n=1 Tax=Leadbetterella byssophila TaxID=316068 RepID=UPI0039A0EEA3
MEEGKCFIGLEIGSSKIAAVVGLQQQAVIKVIGFSERKILPSDEVIKYGNIENAQITCERISEVLDDLAKDFERADYEFQMNTVNINLANLSIQSQTKSGKVVTSAGMNRISQEDINKLTEDVIRSHHLAPGYTLVHALPKDFYVNEEKTMAHLVGKIGNVLSGDYSMITTKSDNLNNLLECVNQVQAKGKSKGYLNVENIYLNTVADSCALLNNSAQEPFTKKDGIAIVNIGAEMTQISVFHGNTMRYQSILPIAGNTINADLEKTFGINFQEAEMLKLVCSTMMDAPVEEIPVVVIEKKLGMPSKEVYLRNAMLVIEWRLKEIAALVHAELHRSGYKSHLQNGIVLTGGTAKYDKIVEIFNSVIPNGAVRKASFNNAIDFGNFTDLRNPKYSTLLGLIVAPAYAFDRRVDNKVLTPKPISNRYPEAPQPPKPTTPPQEDKPSGFSRFLGSIFRRNDLNDDY